MQRSYLQEYSEQPLNLEIVPEPPTRNVVDKCTKNLVEDTHGKLKITNTNLKVTKFSYGELQMIKS